MTTSATSLRPVVAADDPAAARRILRQLRGDGTNRPPVDRAFSAGLRDRIEDALSDVVAALDPDGPAVVVTNERLVRVLACEAMPAGAAAAGGGAYGGSAPGRAAARGALVAALFRQWVVTGAIDDPIADALGALEAMGDRTTAESIAALGRPERVALAAQVRAQAATIRATWPALRASWWPRTRERMAVPVGGGRIRLVGTVDLAVGPPAAATASVCLVQCCAGERRAERNEEMALAALLETLRSLAPPFAVGTFYSASGTLEVQPVTADGLVATAERVIEGARHLARLAAGQMPVATPNHLCAWCPALGTCAPGRHRVAGEDTGRGPVVPMAARPGTVGADAAPGPAADGNRRPRPVERKAGAVHRPGRDRGPGHERRPLERVSA